MWGKPLGGHGTLGEDAGGLESGRAERGHAETQLASKLVGRRGPAVRAAGCMVGGMGVVFQVFQLNNPSGR